MLQDPGCLTSEAVPDQVDRVVFSPRWERSAAVRLSVTRVAVSARVLATVAHGAAFQLVENLTSPARPKLSRVGDRMGFDTQPEPSASVGTAPIIGSQPVPRDFERTCSEACCACEDRDGESLGLDTGTCPTRYHREFSPTLRRKRIGESFAHYLDCTLVPLLLG